MCRIIWVMTSTTFLDPAVGAALEPWRSLAGAELPEEELLLAEVVVVSST